MDNRRLKESINTFFTTVNELRNQGLFKSDKYLGDIGEKICENLYSLTLCESGRQEGHDGLCALGKKYQIKFHNSDKRTNVALGDPDKYDFILVVIGPKSRLKSFTENKFHIYKFSAQTVKRKYRKASGYSCVKRNFSMTPDKVFNL